MTSSSISAGNAVPLTLQAKRQLTAPCGLDCFNCDMYERNITPAMRAAFAQRLGRSPQEVACQGCRASGGCRLAWSSCATLACAQEHGVEFCHECGSFPCAKLAPTADGADRYPHNYKIFNLAKMAANGFEAWATDAADETRRMYYRGKLIVGQGPVVPE